MSDKRTKLSNAELVSIYHYLKGNITHAELSEELDRSRTNGYYYVGRAVAYWLKTGVLHFRRGVKAEDLGGNEQYKKFKEF